MNYDIVIEGDNQEIKEVLVADIPGDMVQEIFDGIRSAMKAVDPLAWHKDSNSAMQLFYVLDEDGPGEINWLIVVFHGTNDYAGALAEENWVA
jgi:hypothetical protein